MRKINFKKYFLKILFSIVLLIYCFFSPFEGIILVKNNEFSKVEALDNSSNKVEKNVNKTTKKDDEINIYFYPLGEENPDGTFANANAEGDSYIITIGDVEILVDGGIDTGSNEAIMYQMRQHVSSDNKWDYIIVTHADKDHIGAFTTVTNNVYKGIFSLFLGDNPQMTLGTIIDFDITQDSTVKYSKKEDLFVSNMYKTYAKNRDEVIKKGTKYFTSTQCCWKKRNLSTYVKGATDKFYLNKNKTISLNILYNYYSDHKFNDNTAVTSADRNNVSVCFTIDYLKIEGKTERLLFTGDLEEYNSIEDYKPIYGETKLIENNPQLKEGVVFYKAGHHGSRTSSSKDFIDAIKPQNVVITAIAGNDSYRHEPNSPESFPALEVTNNLFKYTDKIFIPTVAIFDKNNKKIGIEDYYGEINIVYNENGLNATTSCLMDENGKPKCVQYTDWFITYREPKLTTYVFSGYESEINAYLGNCTLVKYGHYDILIDCGVIGTIGINAIQSNCFLSKIDDYCIDSTIECLIVSSSRTDSIQQLVDITQHNTVIEKGVLNKYKIENLVDFGDTGDPSEGAENSLYKDYEELKKSLVDTNCLDVIDAAKKNLYIAEDLYIDFLYNEYYNQKYNSDVSCLINFKGKNLLFTGNNLSKGENSIVKNNKAVITDVVFFKIPDYGNSDGCSPELLDVINQNSKNLHIVSNCILNQDFFGRDLMNKVICDNLLNYSNSYNVYTTMEKLDDGRYNEICGDIEFSISLINNSDFKYSIDVSKNKLNLSETEYYQNL